MEDSDENGDDYSDDDEDSSPEGEGQYDSYNSGGDGQTTGKMMTTR